MGPTFKRKRRVPIKPTRDAIKRLRPGNERYSVSVKGYPGLEIRVTPTGVKTFSYAYKTADGKRERYTIGKYGKVTPEHVIKKVKLLAGKVAAGENPQADKRRTRHSAGTPTLDDFITNSYEEWVSIHQKSGLQTVKRIRSTFSELTNQRLDQLTPWQIEKWRMARLREHVATSTVNRDLAALRGVIARAVEWNVIPSNPIQSVKAQKVAKYGRTRFLSPDEETRLHEALEAREARMKVRRRKYNDWRQRRHLKVADGLNGKFADHLKPMVLLTLNTGLRRGELFRLEWASVDLRQRNLKVLGTTSKIDETRDIPLNDEALAVLNAWKAQRARGFDLVFPNRHGNRFSNVKKAWAGLLGDAAITDFTWHDLRHHFASRLAMTGVDLNTIRELLGHSEISMTQRYAHLSLDHKAAAVARLARGKASGQELPRPT